jgi:ribosomal protein L37AE/L43A
MNTPVHHCKSCGFISTIRNEYTRKKGILICKSCEEDYNAGDENVTRWINSALNQTPTP